MRGPKNEKQIALMFTGGSYASCGSTILDILKTYNIKASFFFTGEFLSTKKFTPLIKRIIKEGHYISIHSDKHLLYCSWQDRNQTLVSKEEFVEDINNNFVKLKKFGIDRKNAIFWIPPYEWYNQTISDWSKELGLVLVNFTPGTLSHFDYTPDDDPNYRSNEEIFESIITYESKYGLNGFLLLFHIGSSDKRTKKFSVKLTPLIEYLTKKGYKFVRIDEMLSENF
ncbi:MAG: polysaccharide deacetylase family protein [Endomicrobia bacterium]|nr:polysaccharide deacetylase family protein [Endomicrobiia bacterium]